jgi:hypothetical protein
LLIATIVSIRSTASFPSVAARSAAPDPFVASSYRSFEEAAAKESKRRTAGAKPPTVPDFLGKTPFPGLDHFGNLFWQLALKLKAPHFERCA